MASKYVTQAEEPNRSETNKYLDASGHWTEPSGGGGGGGSDERAMISDVWSSTKAYTVGKYAIDGNKLYKCIVANTNMRPSTNPTYWSETNIGNEIGAIADMAQESLIYAGTEIIASENSTRWTASTSFQEVSRTKSIGNGIPEKAGYTKKFKLCIKGVTKENSNLVIAFGNVQMLNFQTWNYEATSVSVDYGTIMRSDLYTVSQLSDIYVEDGNQYYKNFYKLKMRSTASKYVGITTAWLEWYYVKNSQ